MATSMATFTMTGPQVFLSYRRQDAGGHPRRLFELLAWRFGSNQILWDRDIPPGIDFTQWIYTSVSRCRALLALIGREWLARADADACRRLDDPADWVRVEIEVALQCGILVIPVLVEEATMPTSSDLPLALAGLSQSIPVQIRGSFWDGERELMRRLEAAGVKRVVDTITPDNAHRVQLHRVLRGHTGGVSSVAFAPDGLTIATGGGPPPISNLRIADEARLHAGTLGDNTVGLWRVADGTLLHRIAGASGWVSAVAFAPDGETVAAAVGDAIQLWQAWDGTLLRTLQGPAGGLQRIAFAPNGETLCSGGADHSVRVWRVADGVLLETLRGHTDRVTGVAFAPDSQTLASGSQDGTVRLWRVADGALVRSIRNRWGWRRSPGVRAVAFAPDGVLLASGRDDGTVHLWRSADGALVRILGKHASGIDSVAFAPDGATLASGSHDAVLRLWRVADGALAGELQEITAPVTSVTFAPDGTLLASGCWNATVRIWGLSNPAR